MQSQTSLNSVQVLMGRVNALHTSIQFHETELARLKKEKKSTSAALVKEMIDLMQELDRTTPDWRLYNQEILNKLSELLKPVVEKVGEPVEK